MSKPASLFRAAKPKAKPGLTGAAAAAPAGDVDTATIGVLDQQGNPYTGPLTFSVTSAVSSDTTVETTDPPSGVTYKEHFLKAGSVKVAITMTFSDGTTLTETDNVTVTGVPGSLTVTHSLPVVGP